MDKSDRKPSIGAILFIIFTALLVAILAIIPIIFPFLRKIMDVLFVSIPFIFFTCFLAMRKRVLSSSFSGAISVAVLSVIPFFVSGFFLIITWQSIGCAIVDKFMLIILSLLVGFAFSVFITMFFRPKGVSFFVTAIFVSPFVFPFSCGYGYGAAITLNSLLDKSTPEMYSPKILKKYISHGGKGAGPHFQVDVWGPVKEEASYMASGSEYAQMNLSDTMCAQLYSGYFGAKWYTLSGVCKK